MKKLAIALAALLSVAASPQTVQQTGPVTPSHLAKWATSGVIQDAGTSAVPGVSTLGILSPNNCSFSINTALSPAPNTELCWGIVPGQYARLSLTATGGAAQVPLQFDIYGTIYTFPFGGGGGGGGNVSGPSSSVIGDLACWNNNVGTLLYDCGTIAGVTPGTVGDLAVYTGTGSSIGPLTTANSSVLITNIAGVAAWQPYLSLPNNPSVSTSPTGNPTGGSLQATYSTIVAQGTTGNAGNREFMVNFGMVSDLGSGVASNNGDKVVLYTGIIANPGTGDVWSMNPLVQQSAGSGTYNAQIIEADINNYNADKGGTDGPSGYPAHVAVGLSVSGVNDANNYQNTADIAIDSFNFNATGSLFAHGISFNGFYKFNDIVDYSQSPTFLALFGGHTYGIDCYQAVMTGGCLRLATNPTGGIIGRNASNTADARVLRFDGNNVYLGETNTIGIFVSAPITPSASSTYAIGGPSARFATAYVNAVDASSNMFVGGTQVATASGIAGECAQWTSSQNLIATGLPCGGSGSIPAGTAGQTLYYAAGGSTVTPTSQVYVSPTTGFVGVNTAAPGSQFTVNGTMGVSGATSFNSAVAMHGSVQFTGLTGGAPSEFLCTDGSGLAVDSLTPCVASSSPVTSVTSGNGNITVSPTTGNVVITMVSGPVFSTLNVATFTNTSTISDGGTLGVSGAAAFGSAVSMAGSVQMTGLTGGTPTKYLCIDASNLVVASAAPC